MKGELCYLTGSRTKTRTATKPWSRRIDRNVDKNFSFTAAFMSPTQILVTNSEVDPEKGTI